MTTELPSKSFKLIIKKRFAGEWGTEEGTSEVNIPCVRVADFDRARNVVSDDVPTIRSISKKTAKAKQLRNQDILIEKSGGGDKTPVGTPILYLGSENAICSNFIEVVRLRSGHDPRFWTYVLISSYESGNTRRFINQTTGIQNIDSQRFYDQVFQVPTLETQQRIADYLDRETAEIDAAVADLDKYVELLEKRLESTGREILTELSNEHPLIQTKFLVDITTGSGDTQDAVENGDFPFYVRSDTVQRSGEYEFDCDAVLTSGDGAGVGKIFHLASGKFKAHQRVYVMHSFRRVSPTYFYWMFKSTFPDVIKYGGAKSTVDSVRMPMIANLKLPVPPPAIQAKVSGRFANLDQEVSALITESTRLRDLLLKRRSVLITEVVTGRKQV